MSKLRPSRFVPEEVAGSFKPRGCGLAVAVPSASVVERVAEIWSSSDYVRGMSVLWGSTIWCCIATKIPHHPLNGGVPIDKPLLVLSLAVAVVSAAFVYFTSSVPGEVDPVEI
jgi:hypothetical protein